MLLLLQQGAVVGETRQHVSPLKVSVPDGGIEEISQGCKQGTGAAPAGVAHARPIRSEAAKIIFRWRGAGDSGREMGAPGFPAL